MEAIIPSVKDHSTDVMVKYLVLGIILILLFFAIQYIFSNQLIMLEGFTGRKDKGKDKGDNGPLDDENDGDIITIAKRQQEYADKTQKSLNMDEHYNHYSQIIENMDEWVNAKIVNSLKNVSKEVHGEGKMEDIVRHMNELNTMNKFKLTLEECSRYIDTK
jgi:hypothetical protein